MFLFVLACKLAETLARRSIVTWVSLRKAILGDSFVERIWVDFNVDESAKILRAVSIVEFGYADGQLTFGGEVFSSTGNPIGNFDSTLTKLQDHVFWYIYEREVTFGSRQSAAGRGRLKLTRGGGAPSSYYGSFHDTDTESEIGVRGEKLVDREATQTRLGQGAKRDLVLEHVSRFLERNPGYELGESDEC